MKTIGMDALRTAVIALANENKGMLTNQMLYAAMGCENEAEKARVRRRISDMVKRGELRRGEPGVLEYNPKAAPQRQGKMLERIWLAVRAHANKPGWTVASICQLTRAGASHVGRYINFLEAENYIQRHGSAGNTRKYRCTAKTRDQRETPYPPREQRDPHAEVRAAITRMVRIAMMQDLYQPAAKSKLLKECHNVIDFFDKKGGQNGAE